MPIIVERGTCPQEGIGRPDYSGTVHRIERGETYPQFEARPETEKYKIFLGVFTPAAPLAVGATFHLIDIETNLPCPYESPAGYCADFREWFFNVNGRLGFLMDLNGIIKFYMEPDTLINIHEYEQIVWGKSSLLDPPCVNPHTWDFTITNLDDHDICGSIHVALALTLKE